jgi:hypothetical protein
MLERDIEPTKRVSLLQEGFYRTQTKIWLAGPVRINCESFEIFKTISYKVFIHETKKRELNLWDSFCPRAIICNL